MSHDNWECLGCEESNEPDADLCRLCGLAKNANFGDVNQVRKEWLGKRRPKAVEDPPWRATDMPSDYAIVRSAPDTLDLIPDDAWQCRSCDASNEPNAVVCRVCDLSNNSNAQDGEQVTKVWSGTATQESAKDLPDEAANSHGEKGALWILKGFLTVPLDLISLLLEVKGLRWMLKGLLIVPLVLVSLLLFLIGWGEDKVYVMIFMILALIIGVARGRALAIIFFIIGAIIVGAFIAYKINNYSYS